MAKDKVVVLQVKQLILPRKKFLLPSKTAATSRRYEEGAGGTTYSRAKDPAREI
jgi:hypothetical protein